MQHRDRRKPGVAWAFWAPFGVVVVAAFVSQRSLFTVPLDAWGDAAVNGLSVLRAEHFQQLVGNYSRVGFHHPGPGFMYLLAGGEGLFHHLLGVAPAPYNGQLLGVSVYVAFMIASACLVVLRTTGSRGAAGLTFAVVVPFAVDMPLLGQDWFPFLYVSAFLLMMVSGTAVALGRTAELPFFLLASGLLAHGHASFLMFVGVTVSVVLGAWWWRHRRSVRAELSGHRVASVATATVAFLLCLPVLADLVLHFPGEWVSYWEFATHGERQARSAGEVLAFVKAAWTGTNLPGPVYAVAGATGAVLLLLERDRTRRRGFATAYGVVVLQSLLYLYYVARGVDQLTPIAVFEYVGFFYRAVPVFLLVTSTTHLWMSVSPHLRGSGLVQRAAPGLVVATMATVAAVAVLTSERNNVVPAAQTYAEAARAIGALETEGRRPLVIAHETGAVWATGAGVGLALERSGAEWCVTGYNAPAVMFGEHLCTPEETRRGVIVRLTELAVPPGATVVWEDAPADPRLRAGTIRAYVDSA